MKIGVANAFDQAFASAAIIRRSSIYYTTEMVPTVEINVNVEDINVHPSGLHIAGNFTQSMKVAMDVTDDGNYMYQFEAPSYSNVWYILYNGPNDTNAELIPDSCAISASTGATARGFSVDPVAFVSESVCFGTCENCNDVLSTSTSHKKLGFSIYPNPSKGAFQIVPPLSGEAQISIYHLDGKSVFQTRMIAIEAQPEYIEASKLPKGFYIMELRYEQADADRNVYIQKITIQ